MLHSKELCTCCYWSHMQCSPRMFDHRMHSCFPRSSAKRVISCHESSEEKSTSTQCICRKLSHRACKYIFGRFVSVSMIACRSTVSRRSPVTVSLLLGVEIENLPTAHKRTATRHRNNASQATIQRRPMRLATMITCLQTQERCYRNAMRADAGVTC